MNNSNEPSNYSKIDGTMNSSINSNSFTIEKQKDSFCGKCGNKIEDGIIYCKYCGESLEKVRSKNINFKNNGNDNLKMKEVLSSFSLSKCIISAALSIVILFALSLIAKFTLLKSNSNFNDLINPLHIMLLSNFGSIEVYRNTFMSINVASMNIGLIALILLPITSLVISYRVILKDENISLENHVKNSLGVGIIYGLILAIISKLSQINLNLSSGLGQYNYSINYGINMASVLFKGFIIGFLVILFLGLKKEYEENNIYVGALRLIPKVLGIGYILTLVVFVVMYFANINYLTDFGVSSYNSKVGVGLVISQLAFYIWSFANFIPTTVGSNTLSVVTLLRSKISFDVLLILGAFMALSILIFIIVGCKLESKYKDKGIKSVLIFSIFYAIIMGILGLLTLLYISDAASPIVSNIGSMQMGFNMIVGVITSFIYSFITTLIGFKLNISN